jgi:hypothetical protein
VLNGSAKFVAIQDRDSNPAATSFRPQRRACAVLCVGPFGQRGTFAMYKMMIDVSGEERVLLFCRPGCRKRMLEWWDELLGRAEDGEDIREIRVWGSVGNKTDIVREWRTNNTREHGAW